MAVFPRRAGYASAATLAGLTAAFGLAHLAAPGWLRAAGLDVWNVGAAEQDFLAAEDRRQRLDDTRHDLGRQLRVNEELARDLAAGRLSLADVVAELGRVNDDRVGFADGLSIAHPHIPTHRLRVARYAIDKAAARHGDASDWVETVARLEAEYAALRAE